MRFVGVVADRILCAAVLLLFCRGCCLEERVSRATVTTGFYRTAEGLEPPVQGLSVFIDAASETVRFEYAHEGGTVLVEYEATSRRFADED